MNNSTPEDYLICPKCGSVMRLQTEYAGSSPSGSGGGTATTNSTATVSVAMFNEWYEYHCPQCNNQVTSRIRYQDPE